MSVVKRRIEGVIIDWIVRDCFKRIVEASGIVSKLFLFKRHGGLSSFIQLIKEIRTEHYDYVFDMQGLARSGIMTFFSKSDKKIGRSDSRELSRLAYDKRIDFPKIEVPHALDILFQFLKILNLKIPKHAELEFVERPSQAVFDIFKKKNFSKNLILLFPESRRKEKEWPYFCDLSEALMSDSSENVVVVAGQREFKSRLSCDDFYNLSGKTSLDDVIFLIKNSSVVIANDSAPIHIAASMEKKIVAIFGPTDSRRFGPYPIDSARHVILQSADRNISSVTVDDVLNHCLDLLHKN
jgi:ADP-heptose:LPS heptosyltransferase